MTLEVGLFLEFLDVVPVAARVDLPVERGQIVAGEVLPVLGELDAEAFVGTAVEPGQEPLRPPSAPSAPCVPSRAMTAGSRNLSSRAVEGAGIGYIPLCGTGTASSSRSTIVSGVTRSDSA